MSSGRGAIGRRGLGGSFGHHDVDGVGGEAQELPRDAGRMQMLEAYTMLWMLAPVMSGRDCLQYMYYAWVGVGI